LGHGSGAALAVRPSQIRVCTCRRPSVVNAHSRIHLPRLEGSDCDGVSGLTGLGLAIGNLLDLPVVAVDLAWVAPGSTDAYTLTGGSTVGVVRVNDPTIELRSKVGVAAVLFLVSYALDPKSWKTEQALLERDVNLAEAIVPLFTRTAQQAIRPGLLHGYRHREDTLAGVRGRVRIAEQFPHPDRPAAPDRGQL